MDELKFTSVTDSSQMEHAKKSQELQSGVSPEWPFPHHAAVSWAGHPGTTADAAQARSRNQGAFQPAGFPQGLQAVCGNWTPSFAASFTSLLYWL